jgi:hypothetical protein
MSISALAEERGYLVQEVEVALSEGRTRPGWLVYDLASGEYVQSAVNWTTEAEVEAYIRESSG